MKNINFILLAIIFSFIALSVFLKPSQPKYNQGEEINFEIPEITLNIPIDEELSIPDRVNLDVPFNINKSKFAKAWTIKVDTYDVKDDLKKDLMSLKKQGYKVYSRYESEDLKIYGLYIGPTLLKEDSLTVLAEIKKIGNFNPELKKYD